MQFDPCGSIPVPTQNPSEVTRAVQGSGFLDASTELGIVSDKRQWRVQNGVKKFWEALQELKQ